MTQQQSYKMHLHSSIVILIVLEDSKFSDAFDLFTF